ncbi:3-hydroxyacyl-CoA dehydrogenase family protein [Aspergillus homomorphus CBS 101889]|uniref:NAD(P)-binding protein n=1 Tax=Aspergillus homomorphus (strain CBS 101889) TaxID=1450537 RepID=A0A395I140_ASPHC|nr:NAD(P)-binding protein [Aspergillus homomorphus CBS 101889]RAL13399.1 NAD(P)-binding protein [Aspergillus homomorphus CBS 101889]
MAVTYNASAHVAIIGCGTIGRQVALLYVQHDRDVILYDTTESVANEALRWVKSQLNQTPEQLERLKVAFELKEAVEDAWMVIECTPENIDAKSRLMKTLDGLCGSKTIITTNSSTIRSSILVKGIATEGQRRILNTHYFPPAHSPLVELMSCGNTSPDTIEFLLQDLRKLGRHPFLCRADSTGFVANRIWAAIKREVMMVLADGVASPTEIDGIFKSCLHVQRGPCELMEEVGLETVCEIEEIYLEGRKWLPRYPLDFFRQNYVEAAYTNLRS